MLPQLLLTVNASYHRCPKREGHSLARPSPTALAETQHLHSKRIPKQKSTRKLDSPLKNTCRAFSCPIVLLFLLTTTDDFDVYLHRVCLELRFSLPYLIRNVGTQL